MNRGLGEKENSKKYQNRIELWAFEDEQKIAARFLGQLRFYTKTLFFTSHYIFQNIIGNIFLFPEES